MAFGGRAFGRDGPTAAAAAAERLSATSARFTCSPPRHFCDIRALPLLGLPASPYSTLAGERPIVGQLKRNAAMNSYLLTMEASSTKTARLSALDPVWLAKVRDLLLRLLDAWSATCACSTTCGGEGAHRAATSRPALATRLDLAF